MQAVASDVALRPQRQHFYLWMGAVFVLIAFAGFTPTYWVRLASGSLHVPPIVHIHGALLFSWTLFYFTQTAWIATGRVTTHRAWGLAGISLFSVMICSIIATKITLMNVDEAAGYGEQSRRFGAVIFCALPVLIGLFSAAIANIRRPEIHKRLMLVLMAACMEPALARVSLTLFAPPGALASGPPPVFVTIPPALTADLLIVVAGIRDWRTQGRIHPAYIWGGLSVLAMQLLTLPISQTHAWMSIARALQGLAG